MNTQETPHTYQLSQPIYAVGIDPAIHPKEKIEYLHGADSDAAQAAEQLEQYISAPDFRQCRWYRRFRSRLKRMMGILNRRANEYVKFQMAQSFIDELIHDGYLWCLKSMALPSGTNYVQFAQCYAQDHQMPLGAALLFGPASGTRMALRHFLAAERSHGKHRPPAATDAMIPETRDRWFHAGQTINWPAVMDKTGNENALEFTDQEGRIPVGAETTLQQLWRQNPSFRGYTGTNRLSGDTPYEIIEDAVDILFRSSSVCPDLRARYDRIVQSANEQRTSPFYAVYRQLFNNPDQLKPYWDNARQMLYEHSLKLWEQQNHRQLTDGDRIPPDGVTCRVKEPVQRLKKKIPGTIYLNNNRYYWIVAGKMKAVPLIDPATAPKFPGTLFKDGSRYYWFIARFLKRQRLVPKGQKFSTNDRATAEKIALAKWKQIQKDKPAFAAKVLKHTRSQGLATTERQLAEKIALKMWRDIQKNDPKLAAKILTDHRPEPSEHWHAQIKTDGKVRFIGSFKSKQEAQAAYKREFEKSHGYPVGYAIQYMPKMDKVWPTWQEQKVRLASMEVQPVMPVIGPIEKAKPLTTLIERLKKVDWLAHHCMVVLDDTTPRATMDMTIQSRGEIWLAEIKKQGKNTSIYGETAIDRDSRRIRVTLFEPAFDNPAVLAEEVYHLAYRVLGHTQPATAGQIHRWYDKKLQKNLDPTLSEDEAFAQAMVREEIGGNKSDLPRGVVRQAKKLLSPSCRVQDSVFEKMMAMA
jgi:hypothetical protein